MSNVIRLPLPPGHTSKPTRRAALLESFATHRRTGDDVFWLKENAELLNIFESTGAALAEGALAPHEEFYAQVEKRIGFFPQYYRFLLSICLDLEDLGMPGTKGEALSHWVAQQGLADAELGDLQRAEARRLTLRRGIDPLPEDGGLEARLRAFMDRCETFAMPNKKAAYELTHIVFYLSEYGRKDPCLSPCAVKSLQFAGILAYLDQNSDLLAEICVALRYAGVEPAQLWETWLERETGRFSMIQGAGAELQDDYHDFFVCNWALAVAGKPAFTRQTSVDRTAFHRPEPFLGPLRAMSECMFRLQDQRSGDWQRMRPLVKHALSEIGNDILAEAEQSTECFDEFFAGFARMGLRGVTL